MPAHKTHIAGVKFRNGAADLLKSLEHRTNLTLVPDPGNKFDPNAIKVMHGAEHVGFVTRDLAPEVGQLLAAGRVTHAQLLGNQGLEIGFTDETEEGQANGQ